MFNFILLPPIHFSFRVYLLVAVPGLIHFSASIYSHALSYQKILYDNIYNGIDLSFYSNDMFRFDLSGSSNPGAIQIYFQGTDSVKIQSNTRLNIYSKGGNKSYVAYAINEEYTNNLAKINVNVYPNPNLCLLYIGSTREIEEPIFITIFDNLGQKAF